MNIVTKLEAEHDVILEMFKQIDVVDNIEQKKEKIKELRNLLVTHMVEEDEEIYPVLKESHVSESVRLGEVMSNLMNSYASDFVNATNSILNSVNAIEDTVMNAYNECVTDIKNRIKIEESLLFPEYEKIVGNENN